MAIKVLMGELGAERSTRMMEHFRVCGECREAFDFAASTIAKASPRRPAPVAAGPAAGEAESSSDVRAVPRFAMPARRNRRVIFVFGIAMVALAVAGLGGGRNPPPAAGEPSDESVACRLLGGGTPVVESPNGTFDSRPRVITALVPAGAAGFSVTVLDDSGRPVWRSDEKPGERGCFLEPGEIAAGGKSFRAARLLVPFPDEAALPLAGGRPYGVVVAIAGGHASPSSVLQIRAPEGPLHAASRETR
jgi:hypothetical protein